MSDDDERLEWVGPDGRRAGLRVEGATVHIDIEWAGGPERWTQTLDGAESARGVLVGYRERLVRAGFGPAFAGGPSALRPHAALRVAEELRARDIDPARADLIDADLADQADAVQRASERVRASPRARIVELPPIDEAVSVLGGFVWVYDDDHMEPQGGPWPDPDPVWAELEAALRPVRPVQVHAQVFGAYEPARAAVSRVGALDAFSHLLLTPLLQNPVRGEPPPRLLALTGSAAVLEPWLAAPTALTALESLALHGVSGQLRPWLDRLEGLPALRHLAVSSPDVEVLVRHPVIDRLETLDLFSRKPGPTLAVVHAERERLRHLRRLFLPGHLVPAATRAEFTDLPVRFVSHDRLEVLGHDLMRLGYPGGHR